MAHIEAEYFQFGKNLRLKVDVTKARLPDELHAQDEVYPYQAVSGVTQVYYNANVGSDSDPEWVLLEKDMDLGALFAEVEKLKGQVKSLTMYNGKLKRKLQSLDVVAESIAEETDA